MNTSVILVVLCLVLVPFCFGHMLWDVKFITLQCNGGIDNLNSGNEDENGMLYAQEQM